MRSEPMLSPQPQVQQVRLAVIVPVGPGDDAWRALLPQLSWLPQSAQLRLVASRDKDIDQPILEACTQLPTDRQWLLAERGRAVQMNAGVASCQASLLWFLHADSSFPEQRQAENAVARVLGQNQLAHDGPALYYFDLRFQGDGPRWMLVNQWGVWMRSHGFGIPFGDQGFILPSSVFHALGGFDEALPSAEDHALIWAARAARVRILPIGAALVTSARRYAEHGWLATTWRHLRLTLTQARQFSKRYAVCTRQVVAARKGESQ